MYVTEWLLNIVSIFLPLSLKLLHDQHAVIDHAVQTLTLDGKVRL